MASLPPANRLRDYQVVQKCDGELAVLAIKVLVVSVIKGNHRRCCGGALHGITTGCLGVEYNHR